MASSSDWDAAIETYGQESLWTTVERITSNNIVERSEIKKVIGESLIDETIDLYAEFSSLNEIWSDFNQEESVVTKSLPDPPFLRENLEKQITLLVELLQQKLSFREGRPEGFTAFLSEDEREIIKSISRENSSSSIKNTSTAKQINRVPTAGTRTPRVSSATSSQKERINVFEIETLAGTLRLEFENERLELLSNIEAIQTALIHGSNQRDVEKTRRLSSPTIKELQSLNNKLEKTVITPHKPSLKNQQSSRSPKWSNNFQKSKLSPSPPGTANTSTYKHPHLLPGNSPRKLVPTINL